MKIAIIGAGAAGIVAAISAKRLNKDLHIDIFDANKSIGKKILASGNGRCNISNSKISSKNYIGEDSQFVEFALKEFDFNVFSKFCKSIGLLLDEKDDGKVYPLSNEAKSVTNLFTLALEDLGVNIFYEKFITKVEKIEDKFTVLTSNEEFKNYDKVVITSGLGAAPQLNASEIGLEIASSFGHTINATYPSLVGLQTAGFHHAKLQGVKKECLVSLYINGALEQEEKEIAGDVLFTNYGVSGFAILDISQMASYYLLLGQDVKIAINFFPNINKNDLSDKIQSLCKTAENRSGNRKVVDILTGIISTKIAPVLLDICKIPKDIKVDEINAKEFKALAYQLNSWKLQVIGTAGFTHAEASGGGVRTKQIDNKTYESKICKGLYFAGEVLDIVGNRGGYNLHFAFASGYLVGNSLGK